MADRRGNTGDDLRRVWGNIDTQPAEKVPRNAEPPGPDGARISSGEATIWTDWVRCYRELTGCAPARAGLGGTRNRRTPPPHHAGAMIGGPGVSPRGRLPRGLRRRCRRIQHLQGQFLPALASNDAGRSGRDDRRWRWVPQEVGSDAVMPRVSPPAGEHRGRYRRSSATSMTPFAIGHLTATAGCRRIVSAFAVQSQ